MDIKNPKKGDRMAGIVRGYLDWSPDDKDDIVFENGWRFELRSKQHRRTIKPGDLLVVECTNPNSGFEYMERRTTEEKFIPGWWVPVFE